VRRKERAVERERSDWDGAGLPCQHYRTMLTKLGRRNGEVTGEEEGACRGKRRSDRKVKAIPRQHHRTMLKRLGRRDGDVTEEEEGAYRPTTGNTATRTGYRRQGRKEGLAMDTGFTGRVPHEAETVFLH